MMSCMEKKCRDCAVRNHSSFCRISDDQIHLIDEVKHEIEFKYGETIPSQLDGELGFYCIQEGYVKVNYLNVDKQKAVRICGPGELVGFDKSEAIVHGKIRVTALSKSCKLCFLSSRLFYRAGAQEPQILIGVLKMMAKIVGQTEMHVASLSSHYLRNRMASTLLLLDKKFGRQSEFGSKISIDIDRKTLSEMVGTVVESTARILTELEAEKIIVRKGRSIHILDKDQLHKLTQ